MCFDVLLDNLFATNFFFDKYKRCAIVVRPSPQLLRIVSGETVGADLVRAIDFPPDAETVALRETFNDWWRPEVRPGS